MDCDSRVPLYFCRFRKIISKGFKKNKYMCVMYEVYKKGAAEGRPFFIFLINYIVIYKLSFDFRTFASFA